MATDHRPRAALAAMLAVPLLAGAASTGVLKVPDFGVYWAAARVHLAGGNPYDPPQLLPLERQIEPARPEPLPLWGPPWGLALVLPFAWPDFPAARWAWLAATAAGVAWAALELATLYGCRPDRRWVALVLAFVFYPVLQLLGLGQVSGATLFAVAGFLAARARGWPFIAGLFVALTLVKPQVGGFFALAVGLWAVDQRQWRVVLGGLAGGAVLTGLAAAPNPDVFAQYAAAMRAGGPAEWRPPTPGGLLRALAGGAFWPALVPPVAGLAGVVGWYAYARRAWDWRRAAPVLAFVGFFCSPYAWVYDQSVFVVPLVAVAAAASGRRLAGLVAAHLSLAGLAIVLHTAGWEEYQFWWLAPATLIVWWVSGRGVRPAVGPL